MLQSVCIVIVPFARLITVEQHVLFHTSHIFQHYLITSTKKDLSKLEENFQSARKCHHASHVRQVRTGKKKSRPLEVNMSKKQKARVSTTNAHPSIRSIVQSIKSPPMLFLPTPQFCTPQEKAQLKFQQGSLYAGKRVEDCLQEENGKTSSGHKAWHGSLHSTGPPGR
jgi:hypothetical protein